MDHLILILAAVLAGIIGFAAHRASLCSVRAVEELLTSHSAFMLVSFFKTSLWVIGITLLVSWALPGEAVRIGGGVLFGIGATINGGCAFSTLPRLGGGDMGMVASLIGFLVGAGAYGVVASAKV